MSDDVDERLKKLEMRQALVLSILAEWASNPVDQTALEQEAAALDDELYHRYDEPRGL